MGICGEKLDKFKIGDMICKSYPPIKTKRIFIILDVCKEINILEVYDLEFNEVFHISINEKNYKDIEILA